MNYSLEKLMFCLFKSLEKHEGAMHHTGKNRHWRRWHKRIYQQTKGIQRCFLGAIKKLSSMQRKRPWVWFQRYQPTNPWGESSNCSASHLVFFLKGNRAKHLRSHLCCRNAWSSTLWPLGGIGLFFFPRNSFAKKNNATGNRNDRLAWS